MTSVMQVMRGRAGAALRLVPGGHAGAHRVGGQDGVRPDLVQQHGQPPGELPGQRNLARGVPGHAVEQVVDAAAVGDQQIEAPVQRRGKSGMA